MIALYEQPIFGKIVDDMATPSGKRGSDVLVLGFIYDQAFTDDNELRIIIAYPDAMARWYGGTAVVNAHAISIHVPPADGEKVPEF